MKHTVISIFIILLGCLPSSGQESRKEVCIGFPVGRSALDPSFGDNAERLSEVVSFLKDVQDDDTLELAGVSFCGSASPEGGYAVTRRLAEERRASLERYVRERVSLPDSIVSAREGFIDWEYLAELVGKSDMPHREEALEVLRDVPEFTYDGKGVLVDSRKKHLMELQYGRTWNYMLRHFFGRLRNASVILVTVRRKPVVGEKPVAVEEPVVPAPALGIVADTTAIVEEARTTDTLPASGRTDSIVPVSGKAKPFYMALKTNMLYDLLAVPDISAEFYLGGNWSVAAGWMYGWWDKGGSHRYWRVYGGDVAVRRWFGKKAAGKPLTGHHVGVYGQLFTYDLEWGGKGYMGGKPGGSLWDEFNYAFGVEYGYSLPIARRLNIDFTLGVGYWGGKYYEYTPIDGHYVWQATKQRHWFGPTKLEVSLVWLLGRGNFNDRKKGGVR